MLSVLVGMLLYGLLHSVLAGQNIKMAVRHRLGERVYHGFYRLGFNLVALVTILPIILLVLLRPGDTVWQINAPWSIVFMLVQGVGLVGLTVSIFQIDWLRFAGLRQAWAYLNGDSLPLPPEQLHTGGLYGLVRHPLYLFSLLLIWPVSTMSEAYLGFCIGATIYFIIGSYFEEKRMIRVFGDIYTQYQARVPWLLPGAKTLTKR